MAIKFRRRKAAVAEGTPEEQAMLKQLIDALDSSGVAVRVEKGDFRGGFCLVEGEREILFLNKKHSLDSRITALAQEVISRNLLEQLPEDLKILLQPYL